MPAFHYVAIHHNGREQKGVIEAENIKHARQLLREKSLLPITVKPTNNKIRQDQRRKTFSLKKSGLNSKELALFTRQFATLLGAGMPIPQALAACAEQNEKAKIKGIILSVRSKVVEGHAVFSAMLDNPESFNALFTATIAAGEKSGHLDKVLLRLAEYTEQQWQMRQKLRTALIYPTMIVFVAVGIVGFLLEYVVPKMVAVYSNIKQGLPALTTLLIAISDYAGRYGLIFILVLIVGFIIARKIYKKNLNFRKRCHQVLLRLPLFGSAFKTSDTARFSRTLAILSSSGVSVLEAMQIASKLIVVIPIRQAVEEAVNRVREGAAIHLALKQTRYFSPMSVHMVASGEASGQLEPMLNRVAQTQEEDVVRLIEVSLALFEPIVIIIMGGIVLFIVLAVLLPVFQINQFAG